MKILVANLGSTSFKYRLFDMEQEQQLARGGIERIGSQNSRCLVEIGAHRAEQELEVPDHAVAVQQCLAQLTDAEHGCLDDASEVAAIGFKAVHGGRFSGVQLITSEILDAMEEMNGVAPAHNPPYIRAMRLLSERLPDIPLVAAFETGFHQTIPEAQRIYAIPREWTESLQVKRWGFHGASHRYIAERTGELFEAAELARDFLSLGWIQQPVCRAEWRKRGHHDGHEPSVRVAAKQSRGRLRSVRIAADHGSDRSPTRVRAGETCQPGRLARS